MKEVRVCLLCQRQRGRMKTDDLLATGSDENQSQADERDKRKMMMEV